MFVQVFIIIIIFSAVCKDAIIAYWQRNESQLKMMAVSFAGKINLDLWFTII